MNATGVAPRYRYGVTHALDLMVSERAALRDGRVVVGVDEVGRGALAGPLAVGAVVVTRPLPAPEGLDDSKALRADEREALENRWGGGPPRGPWAGPARKRSTGGDCVRRWPSPRHGPSVLSAPVPTCAWSTGRSTCCARPWRPRWTPPRPHRWPSRTSNVAPWCAVTRPARRSRRPRSWPRSAGTGSWSSSTSRTRTTAGGATRATGRPSTWRRCAVWGRASSTVGAGGCRGSTRAPAHPDHLGSKSRIGRLCLRCSRSMI